MSRGTSRDDYLRRIRLAAIQEARPIPLAQPMRPANVSYQNLDIDRAWWYGWSPTPVRQGAYYNEDDQLFITPTNQREADGVDPFWPFWATVNLPPWNSPPFWSRGTDQDFEACVNEYEVDYLVGTIDVREQATQVIRSFSYEVVSGIGQYELFEISLRVGGSTWVRIEDMIIDPTAAAPSERYVFAGDTRPLPTRFFGDRNQTIEIYVRIRGLVAFDGVSVQSPGDPINPAANVRVSLQGWEAPLRQAVDGGPRPTDLGNMMYLNLDELAAVQGFADASPRF